MAWQLQKLSTSEGLTAITKNLPENYGPIFGLAGIKDKIGDLSWLGDDFNDMGWVEVESEEAEDTSDLATTYWARAKWLLQDSDWSMLSDAPLTVEEKTNWIAYRKALREIRSQVGFPTEINWPTKPE